MSTYVSDILTEEFLSSYKSKQIDWPFNGLGYVIYKRTYSRTKPDGTSEEWWETIARCINGAQKIGAKYSREEAEELFDLIFNLKCCFSGRSLWQLGTKNVDEISCDGLLNCWNTKISCIEDFVFIIAESMLGGGVGCNIAKEYTHELPRVKHGVKITFKNTKDADFIVPDSKEGWAELARRILEAYLVTGKSFTYSTICIRPKGDPIKTFGGIAPGPSPLIEYAHEICSILSKREGKKLRTRDVADIICCGGQMVKSGGVRRTALILQGDVDDADYLNLKRWDLGNIPNYRANSNNSLLCSNFSHLSDKFWDGYNGNGEPYGLLNVPLAKKYGRLGEESFDGFDLTDNSIIGFNPCLTKDTSILTTDGVKTIEELIGKKFTAIVNNELFESTDSGFYYQGNKPVVRIILENGLEIKCTPNHKLLTNNGFKEVKDINNNDKIILNNNSTQWRGNGSFDEGWLLGSLLGDGYISEDENHAVLSYWGNTKVALKSYAVSALKKFVKCRSDIGSGKIIEKADRCNVGSTGLLDLARQFDIYHDKNLNSKIESTSYDFYRGFLSGWFDADGSVQGNVNKGCSIRLSSIKLENLKIAQRMLLRLGILSKIYSNRTEAGYKNLPDGHGSTQPYWCNSLHELVISKDQIVKFSEIINFIDENKREKLSKIISNFNRKPYKTTLSSKVFNITSIGNEDVYDCTIPNKECFDANGIISHNCAEATLADKECCNLATLNLSAISSKEEMLRCAVLLYKTQKAIAAGKYLFPETEKIVHKNMRLGLSVSGICQKLEVFKNWCDYTYRGLRKFDKEWSRINGYPQSIRLTVIQPNGTLGGLVLGSMPGGHPGYSKYHIRRVRFSANDKLIPMLRKSGYHIEPEMKFDGSLNRDILVVDFPCMFEEGLMAEDCGAITQLNIVKDLQTYWADQAVSVTVYYKKEELPDIKRWLSENYNECIKSVSFLLHQDHNFVQAPLEKISQQQYERMISKIKPFEYENGVISEEIFDNLECVGGACPIK